MSDDPPDWTNPEGFSPQVGLTTVRDENTAEYRGEMGLFTVVGGDDGGRTLGGGDIRLPPTK